MDTVNDREMELIEEFKNGQYVPDGEEFEIRIRD